MISRDLLHWSTFYLADSACISVPLHVSAPLLEVRGDGVVCHCHAVGALVAMVTRIRPHSD